MRGAWVVVFAFALALAGCNGPPPPSTSTTTSTPPSSTPTLPPPVASAFDAARAFAFAKEQVQYENGSTRYRVPGTLGNDEAASLIARHLNESGWNVTFDRFTADYRCAPTAMHNVVGERVGSSGRIVILGAHYDSRPVAEEDPDPAKRDKPIPGALDSAGSVGVLLELARALGPVNDTVRLVFFDAEDGGDVPGGCDTPWLIGSEHYAESMPLSEWPRVRAMVLVDLVGDANMTLPREGNSDAALQERVYSIAGSLGYASVFTNATQARARITDDHMPFVSRGMPALDLIHLVPAPEYFPEWHHTQHDDLAHLRAEPLGVVGRVLEAWLGTL